jgi:hypothetical protein
VAWWLWALIIPVAFVNTMVLLVLLASLVRQQLGQWFPGRTLRKHAVTNALRRAETHRKPSSIARPQA